MTLRAEDLPKHLREQVEAKAGTTKAGRVKTQAKGAGFPIRCHACGETFLTWGAAVERHSVALGHSRLDLVLTVEAVATLPDTT